MMTSDKRNSGFKQGQRSIAMGSTLARHSYIGVGPNPPIQSDRKGDHLRRTPMRTRFVPDAYPDAVITVTFT